MTQLGAPVALCGPARDPMRKELMPSVVGRIAHSASVHRCLHGGRRVHSAQLAAAGHRGPAARYRAT
jgi:hypothetical protein